MDKQRAMGDRVQDCVKSANKKVLHIYKSRPDNRSAFVYQKNNEKKNVGSENDAHFIIHPNLRVPRCGISEGNIQVTVITLIWCAREGAFNGVACVDEDSRRGVEHGLSTGA